MNIKLPARKNALVTSILLITTTVTENIILYFPTVHNYINCLRQKRVSQLLNDMRCHLINNNKRILYFHQNNTTESTGSVI